MRIILVITILVLINGMGVLAQTSDDKPKRFYNITQVSYKHIKEGTLDIYIPSQGNKWIDMNVAEAKSYSLLTNFGFFIVPSKLSIGLVFGLEGYQEPNFNTFPMMAEVRFYASKKVNTPYVYFDLGWHLKLGDSFERGEVIRLGIGYQWELSSKVKLIADFSAASTMLKIREDPHLSVILRGRAFTIGIKFNI